MDPILSNILHKKKERTKIIISSSKSESGSLLSTPHKNSIRDFFSALFGNLIIYTLEYWIGTMVKTSDARKRTSEHEPHIIHPLAWEFILSYGLMTSLLILLVYFIVVSIIVRIHQKQ